MKARKSHTVDSLREHWLKFYHFYRDPDRPPPVHLHARLSQSLNAISNLISLLTFTATSREDAVAIFKELEGAKTFEEWDADQDTIVDCIRAGELDSQSQLGYGVVDLILIMWLTEQYDLADKYLDRLDSELVGSGRKVHRSLDYKFHLGQALVNFKQQTVFDIPEPTKGYMRAEKHFASLFVLMNAIVSRGDIASAIEFVDEEFIKSNKGKRTPAGFDLNDGEHRLKMPWNIDKHCVLQYAKDQLRTDTPVR